MNSISLDIPTRLTRLASNPEDDQDAALKKSALVITSLMVVAATIWGLIYVLNGEPLAGAIPLSYAILSLLSLIWLTRRNFRLYLISQLTLMLALPFLLMTALGVYALSSAAGIWPLITAIGALTYTSRPQAVRVMGIYLALLIIAGVIGHKKFQYDVWGDAVNVASRMESHGVPGEIQITSSTYELVQENYQCIQRGAISVKGKGEMATWQIVRPSVD